jgi:hypothetical protein
MTFKPEPWPSDQKQALYCDISTMTKEQLQHHAANAKYLFANALELRSLPDGWALRLAEAPDVLARAADCLALNRLCCPQFRQSIVVEPFGGPVWLHLGGPEGIKEALAAEMVGVVREEVAHAGGLRPSRYPAWLDEVEALTQRQLGLSFAQLHGTLQSLGVRPFEAFRADMSPADFFERHVRPVSERRPSTT